MKHKIGTIFKNNKWGAGGCPHLVLLLSSDREIGFEGFGDIFRCAHFQICNDFLLGSQIILFTEFELDSMEEIGKLSSVIPSQALETPVEA